MTTKFEYELNDETVQVEVTSYTPFIPMAMTGSVFGDCDMPQPEYIKFTITDSKGEWVMDEYDASQKVIYDVIQIFKEKMA
jgi:hypothetical protein